MSGKVSYADRIIVLIIKDMQIDLKITWNTYQSKF